MSEDEWAESSGPKENESLKNIQVVNSNGVSLGPFNWESPLGSEIRRGVPAPLAMHRALILRNLAVTLDHEVISTDQIRYMLDGLRDLQLNDQPTPELIMEIRNGARERGLPNQKYGNRRQIKNRVSTRQRRLESTSRTPTASAIRKEYEVWKKEDDDTDPRDTPGPTLYGEEIDSDILVPPVYVVSDFHLGSNKFGKRVSNDMDQKTLRNFIRWLKVVHNEAKFHAYYDVVMNGDFLDLWQASRPNSDTYSRRLDDILDTNSQFFAALSKFLNSHWKCRFHYVIGNHDDPLAQGPHDKDEDKHFDSGSTYEKLRNKIAEKIPRRIVETFVLPTGRVRKYSFFQMIEKFTADRYKMLAEHGHKYDDGENIRDEDGKPAPGQAVSEQLNMMQKKYPAHFGDMEFTPNQETARHLKCLQDNPNIPDEVKDDIEELKDRAVSASGHLAVLGDILLTNSFVARQAINSLAPRKERKDWRERAEEVIEDEGYKVVVFGHTHLHDLKMLGGGAYANSGTWLNDIKFGRGSDGSCNLMVTEGPLPYVKVSKEKDKQNILVQLKFFRGPLAERVVRVPFN